MTTYYVDATGGDDTKDGKSVANAWQTITKVNTSMASFAAGDSILFKCSETWTGTALVVNKSGTSGSPVTFSTYDTGAAPIIDGNDTVNCVEVVGRSYLAFDGLDLHRGLDHGIILNQAVGVSVTDCTCRYAGNDNLLVFKSHDITVSGGTFRNAYQSGGHRVTGIEVSENSYNVTIDGATCCYNGGNAAGIAVFSHNTPTALVPYNVVIQNCIIYGNAEYALYFTKLDPNANPAVNWNVYLDGNTIRDAIYDDGKLLIRWPVRGATWLHLAGVHEED